MSTPKFTFAFLLRHKTIVDLNPSQQEIHFDALFESFDVVNYVLTVKPTRNAIFHAHPKLQETVYGVDNPDALLGLALFPFLALAKSKLHPNRPLSQETPDVIRIIDVACQIGGETEKCLLVLIPQNHYQTVGKWAYKDYGLRCDFNMMFKLCLNPLFIYESEIYHLIPESIDISDVRSRFETHVPSFQYLLNLCSYPFDFESFTSHLNEYIYDNKQISKKNKKFYEITQKYFPVDFLFTNSMDKHVMDLQLLNYCYTLGVRDESTPFLSSDHARRIKANLSCAMEATDLNEDQVLRKAEVFTMYSTEVKKSNYTEVISIKDLVALFLNLDLEMPVTQAGSWFENLVGVQPETLSDLTSKITQAIDESRSFIEQTHEKINNYLPRFATALFSAILVYGILKASFEKDYSIITFLGVISVAFVTVFPSEIMTLVGKIMSVPQYASAQNLEEIPWDTIINLLTLSTAFFTGLDLKKFKFKTKDIIPVISSLPRLDKGIRHAIDAVSDIIISIVNYVREHVYNLHPYIRKDTGVEQVDAFLRQAGPLIERSWSVQPPYSMADYELIIHLQFVGGQLMLVKSFGDKNNDANLKKIIGTVMTLLEKIRRPYDASSLRAKYTRCEPIVIMLKGPPGQGKSYFGLLLAKMIAANCIPGAKENIDKNESSYIYTRAPETVYWDGYAGQYITFLDDLGQSTDQAGQPDSEYMNFIRMVNTFQSPLHMAEMSQKANTFFQSKFVIVTTNHDSFSNVKSINFLSAFKRRFDIVVDVNVASDILIDQDMYTILCDNGIEFTSRPHDKNTYEVRNPSPLVLECIAHETPEPLTYLYARKHDSGKLMLDINKLCNESVDFSLMSSLNTPRHVVEIAKVDRLMEIIMKKYRDKTLAFENSLKYANNLLNEVYENVPRSFDLEMFTLDDIAEEFPRVKVKPVSEIDISEVPFLNEETPDTTNYGIYMSKLKEETEHFDDSFRNLATKFYDYCLSPCSRYFNEVSEMLNRNYYMVADYIHMKFREIRKSMTLPDIYAEIQNYSTYVAGIVKKTISKSIDFASRTLDSIRVHIKAVYQLFPGLADLATLLISWKLFSMIFSYFGLFGSKKKNDEEIVPINPPVPQNASHYAVRSDAKQANRVVLRYKVEDNRIRQVKPYIQAGEEYVHSVAKKVISKNCIVIKKGSGEGVWAHATIICGSVAIIPSHYFFEANRIISLDPDESNTILEMYTSNGVKFKETTLQAFKDSLAVSIPENDLSMFIIPGRLKTFPNIVKHFITEDQLPVKYLDVTLICPDEKSGYICHDTEAIMNPEQMCYMNNHGDKFTVNRNFSYRADTVPGDCGSIIFAKELNYFPSPILGVHIAGTRNTEPIGFSNVLTREVIESCLSSINNFEKASPPITSFKYVKETNKENIYTQFRIAASTSLPLGMASKSVLRKTPHIYGMFGESPFEPAILAPYNKDGVRIDPLEQATLKYQQTAPHIPHELLKAVTLDLIDEIMNNSDKFEYRELTFEEAVEGVPDIKYIDSLSRKTSAGYPYCKLKPSKDRGKQSLFGKIGSYEFDSEDAIKLKEEVNDIIEKARKNERKIHIYGDFLKDETRPIHKKYNPRLVSCAPVEFSIAFRKILLPVHAWFMRNRVKNGFAVGVNPFCEWGSIIEHMQMEDTTQSYIAGDFKGFDTRISSVYQEYVAMVYKAVMSEAISKDPELSNVIDILLTDIFSSVHIAKDNIYYWTSGQPSGNPATTFVNCIINRILIRMCWVVCHNRNIDSVTSFRNYVKDVVYGDDNIISVHVDKRDKFNPTSVSEAMAEFNMIYTSEEKDFVITEFRNFWEISFLKRSFTFDEVNGLILAPLDIDVITFMLYYHKRSKDFKVNIQMAYDSFLDELALHDEFVYLFYYDRVSPIMSKEFDYVTKVSNHQERRLKTLGKKLVY